MQENDFDNVMTEQVISVFTVGHSFLIFVFPDEIISFLLSHFMLRQVIKKVSRNGALEKRFRFK